MEALPVTDYAAIEDQQTRVQIALRAAKPRVSQREVGRIAGVSEGTVSRVVAGSYSDNSDVGRATRDRVRAVIAMKAGVPAEVLFHES